MLDLSARLGLVIKRRVRLLKDVGVDHNHPSPSVFIPSATPTPLGAASAPQSRVP